jgi:hypothetical protein
MVNAEPNRTASPLEHGIYGAHCCPCPPARWATRGDAVRCLLGVADPSGVEGLLGEVGYLGSHAAIQRGEGLVELNENTTTHGTRIGKLVGLLPVLKVVTQPLDCTGDSRSRLTGDFRQISVTAVEGIDEIRPGAVEQVPVIRQPYRMYLHRRAK